MSNSSVKSESIGTDEFMSCAEFTNDNKVAFTVVPEPSTALLLASGLLALGMARRT